MRYPTTRAAIAFATRAHAGQSRADGSPFVLHPLEVAGLLSEAFAGDDLVAAGVLHDVLEKTSVRAEDLLARFGPHITGLVLAVSEDERIAGYARRKDALRRQVAAAGEDALALFAADKLSKLRELVRDDAGSAPPAVSPLKRARKLRHYEDSLTMLEERLPGSPLVGALRRELDACRPDGDRNASRLTHAS